MARLGDVCSINPKPDLLDDTLQVSFVPMQKVSETGDIDVSEIKLFREVKKGFTAFRDGDVLLAKITPCLENGKGAIAKGMFNGVGFGSTEFHVLRPNYSEITSEWLFYMTSWEVFRKECEIHMTGSAGQKRVPKAFLDEYEIRIPTLDEQQNIVRVLDRICNLISLRKQQLAKLDELVKARFMEMFGDPVLNQKKFLCYRVNDVIEFQGGSQPDKKYFEYMPTADNIRLIQIRDYKSDRYKTYIPKSLAKRFCTADDIMIGRYGPPIFQILSGIEGSFNVALMKAIPQMGNKEFIRQYLKQECLLKYLEGLSKRTAGQDGIQMDKLKAYPLPFPPIELQNEFANFSEQIGNFKLTIQQSLDKLEVLKKALMQEYFG